MDIDFPASTTVNMTQNSNLNSILEILNSDERAAKRRKEMKDKEPDKIGIEVPKEHNQNCPEREIESNFTESVKEAGNIPKTVSEVAADVNAQKIPTAVFEKSDDNVKGGYNTMAGEQVPEQQMNVDVVVRTIPNGNDVFSMTSNEVHHSTRQYPRIDTMGSRVHKNKEFLKRFLKDNGVRTLIKTKLDEIHRSPVYQSVLKGQSYIPTNIEGSLGQNNNATCSVV